jgi:hypothetical protein
MEMVDSHLRRAGSSAAEICEYLGGKGYIGHMLGLSKAIGAKRLTRTPLLSNDKWRDGDVVWTWVND